jgi:hypothetical protein
MTANPDSSCSRDGLEDAFLTERVERAQRLRTVVRDPVKLAAEAGRLLRLVPDSCDVLVSWSNEGFAIGAAAAVIALDEGRQLSIERASHLRPLDSIPASSWTWVNVEEALGIGDVRPWAKEWALRRGGELLTPRSRRSDLDLVA